MISLCRGARQVETDLTHFGAVVHEKNTQIGIFAMNTLNAIQQKLKGKERFAFTFFYLSCCLHFQK